MQKAEALRQLVPVAGTVQAWEYATYSLGIEGVMHLL